jgi:hypothetical protein
MLSSYILILNLRLLPFAAPPAQIADGPIPPPANRHTHHKSIQPHQNPPNNCFGVDTKRVAISPVNYEQDKRQDETRLYCDGDVVGNVVLEGFVEEEDHEDEGTRYEEQGQRVDGGGAAESTHED